MAAPAVCEWVLSGPGAQTAGRPNNSSDQLRKAVREHERGNRDNHDIAD